MQLAIYISCFLIHGPVPTRIPGFFCDGLFLLHVTAGGHLSEEWLRNMAAQPKRGGAREQEKGCNDRQIGKVARFQPHTKKHAEGAEDTNGNGKVTCKSRTDQWIVGLWKESSFRFRSPRSGKGSLVSHCVQS